MEQITKILTSVVSDAFAACGYESRLGGVTASDRPELCQFQCNGAFGAAKTAHKPPFVVAEEIAEKLGQVFAAAVLLIKSGKAGQCSGQPVRETEKEEAHESSHH